MSQKGIRTFGVIKSFHRLLADNQVILLPFACLILIEIAALFIIYYAPRPPLSVILAPPIRRFFGDQYLHYPQNFILIPRLFKYAHAAISFTVGILVTAICLKLVQLSFTRKTAYKHSLLKPSLKTALRKFLPMVIFFAIFYTIVTVGMKFIGIRVLSMNLNENTITILHTSISFCILVLLQTVVALVFPILIVDDVGLFTAIKRNVINVFRYFPQVLLVVFLPSCIYIAIAVINRVITPIVMRLYEHEMLLAMISMSIVLTVMMDLLITGYCGMLYVSISIENSSE